MNVPRKPAAQPNRFVRRSTKSGRYVTSPGTGGFHQGDKVFVKLGAQTHRAVVVGDAGDRVKVEIYVSGANPDEPLTSSYRPEELTPA